MVIKFEFHVFSEVSYAIKGTKQKSLLIQIRSARSYYKFARDLDLLLLFKIKLKYNSLC